MDALSELLRVVKLRGALFFDALCSAPWCVRAPPSGELGRYLDAPAGHVIEFHLISEGRAWIRVGGETTPLAAGDVGGRDLSTRRELRDLVAALTQPGRERGADEAAGPGDRADPR